MKYKGLFMNLALFDFDGTLTVNDNYTAFIRFTRSRTRFVLTMILLLPVIIGYKAGLITSTRTRVIVSRAVFRGYSEQMLEEFGRRYAAEIIPLHLRKKGFAFAERHRAAGDRIVVVSASLGSYLRHWCVSQGFECLSTELEAENGIMTGRYVGGDCTGDEKSARVLKNIKLDDYDTVFAYGDTSEDKELLELAHRRFFRGTEVKDVPVNVNHCFDEREQ